MSICTLSWDAGGLSSLLNSRIKFLILCLNRNYESRQCSVLVFRVSLSHAHAQIGLSLKLIKADMQTTTTGSLGGRWDDQICQYFFIGLSGWLSWFCVKPTEQRSCCGWRSHSHFLAAITCCQHKNSSFLTVLSEAQKWIFLPATVIQLSPQEMHRYNWWSLSNILRFCSPPILHFPARSSH